MALKLDSYNDDVKQWADNLLKLIKSSGSGFSITHRENSPSPTASLNKFKNRLYLQGGAVNRIGINFPRSLIYTHKGAGKGRGGVKGSRWVDKYGTSHTTNPKSMGKMGTGGRKEKPFINKVLDGSQGMEKLADIVAEKIGDTIVGNLFIK